MKFGDSETKMAVREFLAEAEACAQHRKEDGVNILGFSAMLTAFSCILAVGEMLVIHRNTEKYIPKNRPRDWQSIGEFYSEMQKTIDERTWLVPPDANSVKDGDPSFRENPGESLTKLRNALVHAVSMTSLMALVPRRESVKCESFRGKWCIVVPDFVAAVSQTFERVAEKYPDVEWDPFSSMSRAPSTVISSEGSLIGEMPPVLVDLEGETELMEYLRRRSGYGTV